MSDDLTHYGVAGMRWGVRNDRTVARAGRLSKKADRNERLATSAKNMGSQSAARAAKRYSKVATRARNKSERLVPTKYTADKLSKAASGLERKAIDIRGSRNIATRIIGAPAARRYEAKASAKRDAAMEIMKTVTFERPFNPRTQGDRADRFRSQVSERSGEPYSPRPTGGNDRGGNRGKSSGKGKDLAWGLAATVATGLAKPTAQRMGEAVAVYVGGKAVANPKLVGKIGEAAVNTLARSFAKQSDVSIEDALYHLGVKGMVLGKKKQTLYKQARMKITIGGNLMENDHLMHYGTKGMKWGKKKQPIENAKTSNEQAGAVEAKKRKVAAIAKEYSAGVAKYGAARANEMVYQALRKPDTYPFGGKYVGPLPKSMLASMGSKYKMVDGWMVKVQGSAPQKKNSGRK